MINELRTVAWQYWHKVDSLKRATVSVQMDMSVAGADEYAEHPLVLRSDAEARIAELEAALRATTADMQEVAGLVHVVGDAGTDEILRLRAELQEAHSVLPGVTYMDPPDGGSVSPTEQLRRMAMDAERYRWLRQQHWNEAEIACVVNPKAAVKLGHDCPSLERLDAAIDAARAALKSEAP